METTYKIKYQVWNTLYMTLGKVKLCTGNFNNFAMHYIPYH